MAPWLRNGIGSVANQFSKRADKAGDVSKAVSGARYGERKISEEVRKKLRASSPTKKIQNDVNKNIDDLAGTPDPALPGKTVEGKLHADHIVSLNRIGKMDGFETLTYKQQQEIANFRENFIGLTETANKSKGPKSYEEWMIFKKEGIAVNTEFRKEMMLKEIELESKIQSMIDKLNKE